MGRVGICSHGVQSKQVPAFAKQITAKNFYLVNRCNWANSITTGTKNGNIAFIEFENIFHIVCPYF